MNIKNKLISFIAIISALITIFVFFSGKSYINDVLPSKNKTTESSSKNIVINNSSKKPNSIVGDWYFDKVTKNGVEVTDTESPSISKNEPYITFLKNGKAMMATTSAYINDVGEVAEIRGIEPSTETLYSVGTNSIQLNIYNRKEDKYMGDPIEIKYKLTGNKLRISPKWGEEDLHLLRFK